MKNEALKKEKILELVKDTRKIKTKLNLTLIILAIILLAIVFNDIVLTGNVTGSNTSLEITSWIAIIGCLMCFFFVLEVHRGLMRRLLPYVLTAAAAVGVTEGIEYIKDRLQAERTYEDAGARAEALVHEHESRGIHGAGKFTRDVGKHVIDKGRDAVKKAKDYMTKQR